MTIVDSCKKKREEIKVRFKGLQDQYTELVNHGEDVKKSIKVLEGEFLRIEGELRILEEIRVDEAKKITEAKNKS